LAQLEGLAKTMKTPLITIVALLIGRCGGTELSFTEQKIALPRLALTAQYSASRPSEQNVPKEVERLANAEFQRRFGLCGMIRLVERSGDAWTFSTRVGYGGTPGPDLTVFFHIKRTAGQEPNRTPELMAPSGRGSP